MARLIKELLIDYDRDADVLYLSLGESRPSICEEVEGAGAFTLVRRCIKTGKRTGVTIIGFACRFASESELKNLSEPETIRIPL